MCVCVCVCVCMCPLPRLKITSGVMWHDMTPYDWLNKFYNFYIAAVVSIISIHGFIIEACHRNEPNKSKVSLQTFHFNSQLKKLYISDKMGEVSYLNYEYRYWLVAKTYFTIWLIKWICGIVWSVMLSLFAFGATLNKAFVMITYYTIKSSHKRMVMGFTPYKV